LVGPQDIILADSIASLSRRVARTKYRKISEILFRYYPAKRGITTIHDFDGDLSISLDRASYISSAIYWAGHHSLPLVRYLRKFLTPEMTLADVGANIGEITLLAAKRLSKGRVLAFEPTPEVFAQLKRNVSINNFSSVELFNYGLYDQIGSLPVYAIDDHPFGTRNDGVTSLFSDGNDHTEMSVPLRRFDDVACESGLTRLDIMKIDVEGAELMVLKGTENSIKKFRPVIIAEISACKFRRAGYTPEDLLGYLDTLDYDVRDLENGSANLPPECDALCLPRGVGIAC
jgi:FkbM family methyltransferase